MDALRLEAIFNVLVEIRDRLPEKAAAEKSTSVTEVMTDAIRLEKVRELAREWYRSTYGVRQDCAVEIFRILGEE